MMPLWLAIPLMMLTVKGGLRSVSELEPKLSPALKNSVVWAVAAGTRIRARKERETQHGHG